MEATPALQPQVEFHVQVQLLQVHPEHQRAQHAQNLRGLQDLTNLHQPALQADPEVAAAEAAAQDLLREALREVAVVAAPVAGELVVHVNIV